MLSLIGAPEVMAARSQSPSSWGPDPQQACRRQGQVRRQHHQYNVFEENAFLISKWGSAEKQDSIHVSSLHCQFFECILHFKKCSLIQWCVCPALKLQEGDGQGCLSHLSIPKCFIESLAHIYAKIHVHFIHACFCCILATFVRIETPVQGSTNFSSGRPESKYFSPLEGPMVCPASIELCHRMVKWASDNT